MKQLRPERRAPLAVVLVAACVAATLFHPAGARAEDPTVQIDNFAFSPPSLTVKAGTTVTWKNDDHFTHSVQFLDGGLPTAPMVMDPGASVSFTFSQPGLFHYQCHLHPQNMQGTVTVGS